MGGTKICPVSQCTRPVEFRVLFKQPTLGTERYTRMCRKHVSKKYWPTSWGVVVEIAALDNAQISGYVKDSPAKAQKILKGGAAVGNSEA